MENKYTVKIKALTSIWTGDKDRKNSTLRETGIIGSLRWWYEAMIRGLGGYACDPTSDERCSLDQKEFKKALEEGKSIREALSEQICPACQLFGCTGWSRKFILRILDKDGRLITGPVNREKEMIFEFIPIKEVSDEEWALLNLTLHFVAEYGAIGGKTVLKPSDEENRKNKPHHMDFGLIKITEPTLKILSKEKLENYVKTASEKLQKQPAQPEWVSIKNFWCVMEKYLTRENENESSFNKVLGRCEEKSKAISNPNDNPFKWLAGSQKESKKIFSFKDPPRTFGFVNPNIGVELETIHDLLKKAWENENGWKFLTGEKALDLLYEKWRDQSGS